MLDIRRFQLDPYEGTPKSIHTPMLLDTDRVISNLDRHPRHREPVNLGPYLVTSFSVYRRCRGVNTPQVILAIGFVRPRMLPGSEIVCLCCTEVCPYKRYG